MLNYLSVIFVFRKPYFNLKSLHSDYEMGVSLVHNMLLSKIIWQFARISYIRVLCYWIGGCFQRSVHPYLMVNVQCMRRMDANLKFLYSSVKSLLTKFMHILGNYTLGGTVPDMCNAGTHIPFLGTTYLSKGMIHTLLHYCFTCSISIHTLNWAPSSCPKE